MNARRAVSSAMRGWTIVPVDSRKFCWAYSIGFMETLSVPDPITFGPSGDDVTHRLIDVRSYLADGRLTLQDGLRWDGLGFEVCWRRVHESHFLGFGWFDVAKRIREQRTGERVAVEAFQMFIPDAAGLYPWEPGCDREVRAFQPMLFLPFDPGQIP